MCRFNCSNQKLDGFSRTRLERTTHPSAPVVRQPFFHLAKVVMRKTEPIPGIGIPFVTLNSFFQARDCLPSVVALNRCLTGGILCFERELGS